MFSSKKHRLTVLFLACMFLVAPLMANTVDAAQVTWIVQTVDAALHVGEYCSMKIDSNNHIHIAYYDDYWKDLKYALSSDGGSTWSIGPVDTGFGQSVGKFCSLALDSNNRPHISYFDETNTYLRYARWNGTNWEIAAMAANAGGPTSIAIDSKDNPHISYFDYNFANLKYVHWTGVSWLYQAVENHSSTGTIGFGSAIALDSNDQPSIAYRSTSPDQLKFASFNGTSWNIEVVDDGPVLDPSIAIDDYDVPHISYYDMDSKNLMYAVWIISFWFKETVDASADVGQRSSIALDSITVPHISYYDAYWQDLKYAKMEPGIGWLIKTIDTVGDMGSMGTSIALDSGNHPSISYNDSTNNNLKYAKDPDETLSITGYEGFDSDGDQNDDSLLIFMDINTNYASTLNVSVSALLIDPSGQNFVDDASSVFTITGSQVETNNLILTVPAGSPEGMYTVKLFLTDEIGNPEDTITLNNAAYLYPLNATTQISSLQGTVTDIDTGLPIDAEIIVNDDWANPSAYTNGSGYYSLQLPAGEYKISVQDTAPQYFSETANVTVITGVIITQNFQLERSHWSLSVEAEGSGTIQCDLFGEPEPPPFIVTYQINSTAQVQAFPSTGWRLDHWRLDDENIGKSNPISVYMNANHLLVAVFTQQAETGWLTGTVTDLTTGVPIAETEIATNSQSVFTDPAGNYEMQLPAGNYAFTVKAALYHNQTLQTTITSGAITTRDFALERSHWTLIMEIEGAGATNLAQGPHILSLGFTIQVEAQADPGWTLSYWILDSNNQDPTNPFNLKMDAEHTLRAVFIETSPTANIESSNPDGNKKDAFDLGEPIFAYGNNYSPSTTYNLYIVEDQETWTNGTTIPTRIPGTTTTITSNNEGAIPPTIIWNNPQAIGKYDIVIDVNSNGVYDSGVDALDNNDTEVTAGMAIPEFSILSVMPLFMIITLSAILGYISRSKKIAIQKPLNKSNSNQKNSFPKVITENK